MKTSDPSPSASAPVPFYGDPTAVPPSTNWRWLSQWPTAAQIVLWVLFMVSGGGSGSIREIVQSIFGGILVCWGALDLGFNPDHPRACSWGRRKRLAWSFIFVCAYCLLIVWRFWL